jgi:hypothetical protein
MFICVFFGVETTISCGLPDTATGYIGFSSFSWSPPLSFLKEGAKSREKLPENDVFSQQPQGQPGGEKTLLLDCLAQVKLRRELGTKL